MIQENELRRGNFVKHGGNIVKVNRFDGYLFGYDQVEDSIGGVLKQAEPIKLTEGWLIQFGFTLDIINEGDRPIYYINNFYIDYDTLQPVDSGFPIAKYEIKHVHQLQNLYFSLYGEELEVKNGI